jgi:hypothetical protein
MSHLLDLFLPLLNKESAQKVRFFAVFFQESQKKFISAVPSKPRQGGRGEELRLLFHPKHGVLKKEGLKTRRFWIIPGYSTSLRPME